jgi:hypothetical protein
MTPRCVFLASNLVEALPFRSGTAYAVADLSESTRATQSRETNSGVVDTKTFFPCLQANSGAPVASAMHARRPIQARDVAFSAPSC